VLSRDRVEDGERHGEVLSTDQLVRNGGGLMWLKGHSG